MGKKKLIPVAHPPRKVDIGGFTYEIEPLDPKEADENDILGDCGFNTLLIRVLMEGLHRQRVAEVTLHEILHGCWSVSNLPKEGVTEEQAVEALGLMLIGVIRHNPELIQWLQDQLRDPT